MTSDPNPTPNPSSPREALILFIISGALAALVGLIPESTALARAIAPTLSVLAWIAPAYALAARRGADPLVAHALLVRPKEPAKPIALAFALLPLYAIGFLIIMPIVRAKPLGPIDPSITIASIATLLAWHLAFVALPEEYFFRGVLQPALGARFGVARGVALASLGFALAHVVFDRDPARAIVFFPSLVFGWLRARTGSIAPGIAFHAACNALDLSLREGYLK